MTSQPINLIRQLNSLPCDARILTKYGNYWVEYPEAPNIEAAKVDTTLMNALLAMGIGPQFDSKVVSDSRYLIYRPRFVDKKVVLATLTRIIAAISREPITSLSRLEQICAEAGLSFRRTTTTEYGCYWAGNRERRAVMIEGLTHTYYYSTRSAWSSLPTAFERCRSILEAA